MCAKCQGQLGHFNSSVFKVSVCPTSPDLVSQSFCYTGFTTICKLEPLTWNVRLVPIWKCQPSVRHKCWRNHPGERGNKGLVTRYWHWLHHELHVDIMAAQISHALLWGQRTSLESRVVTSAGPGTAITRTVWALAWRWRRMHRAPNISGLHRHMTRRSIDWLWLDFIHTL